MHRIRLPFRAIESPAPPFVSDEVVKPAEDVAAVATRAALDQIESRWRRRAEHRFARARTIERGRTIVHFTAEYSPYARTGGLGEAVAGLAGAQARAGHEVVVFMPLYAAARAATRSLVPLGPAQSFQFGERLEHVRYYRDDASRDGPLVIFVDAPAYFDRAGLYGEQGADYPDNCRRFAYFSRAAIRAARQLAPLPSVLHAHDWHTGLVPVYVRSDERLATDFAETAVVFSVHNAGYQGRFVPDERDRLDVPAEFWATGELEAYGQLNLLRGGLAFSDAIVTVSPAHAMELVTEEGGFGLHRTFLQLGDRLSGICNGIDQELWNPATDPLIAVNYSATELSGKAVCKAELQRRYRLPERAGTPVFGMSTRVVQQKGFDLILRSARVREIDAQFVFLGKGDPRYQDALSALAQERPEHVAVEFDFTDEREHELMAGADFLLMPSLYEPCGLSQLRAQRYGVPVVARRVGGLRDTIDDGETGFLFDDYHEGAFDVALDRAVAAFAAPDQLLVIQQRAMGRDFGWERSALQYMNVYDAAGRHSAATR